MGSQEAMIANLGNNVMPEPDLAQQEMDAQFKRLCTSIEELFAKNKMGAVSNQDKLYLYSRYKQATKGDNTEPRSKVINLKAKAMWEAWESVKGYSHDVMVMQYIAKAELVLKQCKTQRKSGGLSDAFKAMTSWMGRGKNRVLNMNEDDLRDNTINQGLIKMGIEFDPREDIVVRYNRIRTFLEENDFFAFYNVFDSVSRTTASYKGQDLMQLSSYSYLNLMTDPRLVEIGMQAVRSHGLGSHGTRSLAGTTNLHIALEETIAEFVGKEMSLTFSTAYLANIGTIAAICRKTDFILIDQKAHRSLQDGCLLSRATLIRFHHNNIAHCSEKLRTIRKIQDKRAKRGQTIGLIFLVSDTVFSMDGDIFPLPRFHMFCKTNNITLILDEAHGLGVIGKTGRGIEEHFDMPGTVDVLTGTLGKSIPAIGGFCAGSKKMMRYIQMYGNPCVFSSPLPPFYCAVAQKTFEILMEEPQHVEQLHRNTEYFIKRLKAEGFNVGRTETAVVPLILGDLEKVGMVYRELRTRGYWVSVIIPPAVSIGSARLRLIPHSGLTILELDNFINALKEAMA